MRSVVLFGVAVLVSAFPSVADPPGTTLHLGFESEQELLGDFVSQSQRYKPLGRASLDERELAIAPGRFGNALDIKNGWAISKGSWNESGLDCDLIVAVMWGEWHKKPHYWGAGAFHGNQGTVAFWVKSDTLNPGIVFMQGSVAWGRKERDLFTVEVDKDGRFSAHIRDVAYQYHRVKANRPTWVDGEWQHIAVSYDSAYGMKLFCNGELVGSTWGKDAWWQTTNPGLFSPFLPESMYDEIYFFDVPLELNQVKQLHEKNTFDALPDDVDAPLPTDAQRRLMKTYGDLTSQELPVVNAGQPLALKQSLVKSCTDEDIPAGWVMDGRYELAWPHPYRLFTFVLGDADFHGTKVDLELEQGEHPDYVSFEGILDELDLFTGQSKEAIATKPAVSLGPNQPFFVSRKLDDDADAFLHIPLTKRYGSPPDLEGSAYMPLTEPTRIHEMHLWQVLNTESAGSKAETRTWPLTTERLPMTRYDNALNKLMSHRDRRVVVATGSTPKPGQIAFRPLEPINLFGPDLNPETAVDTVNIYLSISPAERHDWVRVRLRDPGNPSRIWAQTWVEVDFTSAGHLQSVELSLDVVNLMLAPDDRLWIELTFRHGGTLELGDGPEPSSIGITLAMDEDVAKQQYADYALLPGRLQYIKEYNYRPWRFSGEHMTVQDWSNFGGPYDMAYAPLEVLKHAPDDPIANTYRTLALDRDWAGSTNAGEVRPPHAIDAPVDAPAWAIWQRELYRLNEKAAHWIAARQRDDGMFWGGPNDDCFIPLGYAGIPLLGDEIARRSWLKYYEGLEQMRIFHDGYCDIWPIDPLHITDFIGSRGLMLSFALGDPYVVERELRTSQRYTEIVDATNKRRTAHGLPQLTGDVADREKNGATLVEQVEAEIRNYSLAHLQGYWGVAPIPEPHILTDRDDVARRMMDAVQATDEAAFFALTEGMIHTDNQRGIGRDVLIETALGGRVQGRVEPYPIGIAASWEDVQTPELSRLVSYADDKKLVINLYNFGEADVDAILRVWRLSPGKYSVKLGRDEDDDGVPDSEDLLLDETRELARFSTLPLTVPPQKNVVLTIEQTKPINRPETLPDLAIGPRDIKRDRRGNLRVTVHNIGSASAENIDVILENEDGDVLEIMTIPRLDTPMKGLTAQHTDVFFRVIAAKAAQRIVIDPENTLTEIHKDNNVSAL